MTEEKSSGQLLVCEDYPGMREAFKLVLGNQYQLIFADDSSQIMALLHIHPVRLVIWDLDRANGSLDETFDAIRAGNFESSLKTYEGVLETLKAIRQAHPTLKILLISGEFEYDFQIAAIQQCGDVRFLTKPWKSATGVLEQVQVMLGDRENSIHHRILRVPIAPSGDA